MRLHRQFIHFADIVLIPKIPLHQQFEQGRGDIPAGSVAIREVFGLEILHQYPPAIQRAFGQGLADFVQQLGSTDVADVAQGRQLARLDAGFGVADDFADLVLLAHRDEGKCLAFAARAASTPDPVHIAFHIVGDVIVDHRIHIIHVNSACGHIRRHQNLNAVGTETAHHPIPLGLVHVAMQPVGLIAALLQVHGYLVHAAFGGTEHQSLAEPLRVQHAAQGIHLLVWTDLVVHLLDGGDREHLVGDGQHLRLAQETLAQFADRLGHGGGEQDPLAVRRALFQNKLDILAEAHVQHFVGLVQHDNPRLAQAQRAALQMIDNPARRAHDHLCALGKRPKLPLNGLPAVNRQNRNAPFVYGQFAQFFGYLNGQLAGRAKHQRLHALAGSDLFQNGQAERRRFAGSGLRLAHGILSRQQCRDSQNLNGGGFFKS